MKLRFFAVPALSPAQGEAEVNQLLAEGRVLTVERQFVAAGDASYWALCISLAPPPGPLPEAVKGGGTRRVDYREVLDEADFAVFVQLRNRRKKIAAAGLASASERQRAADVALSTLHGSETSTFRHRLLASGVGFRRS